jgi:hypothetical protein
MESGIYKLGHHLVVFLDVLGQRDKFRRLKKPTNPQEEGEVKEVLRQTAGFVTELRTVFQRQFEVFEAGVPNVRRHTNEGLRPRFTGFSDSSSLGSVAGRGFGIGAGCYAVFGLICGLRRHANCAQ